MKVVCVIDNLGSGGAQRQLVNVACGLKARGHEVEFFCYYPQDHFKSWLDERAVPVHLITKPARFSIRPMLALRRLVQQGRFDSVLAFLETPAVYAELACVGLAGVRILVSERNIVFGQGMTIERYLKSQLHRKADAVVSNSHTQHRWLATHFPFLRPKLRTIWNGIDTAVFRPGNPPVTSNGTLHLLGVGRIHHQKNLVTLAQALGQCMRRGIAVTLDWVGRVEEETYYQEVLSAIADAGVASRWHWLGERKDIADLMPRFDALILPSLYEGLPNVACEALASGLPVLISEVSDNSLLVPPGERGLTFPPDRAEAIVGVIGQFASLSRLERNRMARSARSFAEQNLSITVCVDAYEKLLGAR